jgi:uncharacterized protein YxjI
MSIDAYIKQYSKMYGDDYIINEHAEYTEITFRVNGIRTLIGKLFKQR